MNHASTNPFPNDRDRGQIWDMIVQRDIDAFLAQDWHMIEDDFIEEGFFGIDARKLDRIDSWRIAFPNLEAYRREWLRQAADFALRSFRSDKRAALFEATTLRDIEINGNAALAHKKFDGELEEANGDRIRLHWQTLYVCGKVGERWKIAAFTGYLPHGPLITADNIPAKRLPAGASQHSTAGPYSPVLEVTPGRIVVISGQAALDETGRMIGETIEEQTRCTLENCLRQLATAGCTLADVFKANIYMTDLTEWERMNQIYLEMIPEPRPVRTTVGVQLLMALRIEIEMWAVKPS